MQGPVAAVAILTRPTLGDLFFTHPTHRLLCNRLPGTHALPKRAPPHECSLQASVFFPTRSSLDQSKRARARYFFSPRVGRWEPPASCERCAAPLLRSLLLTRPTLGAPRRALFPGGDGETPCSKVHSNGRSKLAHSPFGAGLIGLLLRAWTSTDFLQIRLIWCARSASKGDQRPSPLSFWRARWASKGSCLAYPFTLCRAMPR